MSIEQILELDCRKNENVETLQNELHKIKPLKKDTSQERVERVIKILCNKYKYSFKIYPDTYSNESLIIWQAEIINSENIRSICFIYGCTMYETLCKVAIKLYSIR